MPGMARVGIDSSSNQMLISGSGTVFINNQGAATAGATINAAGANVVAGSTTVFIEHKGIAREGDIMADGQTITTSGPDCFCS